MDAWIPFDYDPFLILLFQLFDDLSFFIKDEIGDTGVDGHQDLFVFCDAGQLSDLSEEFITDGSDRLGISPAPAVVTGFTEGPHQILLGPFPRHLDEAQL